MNGVRESKDIRFPSGANPEAKAGFIGDPKGFSRLLFRERKRIERSGGCMILVSVDIAKVSTVDRVIILSNVAGPLAEGMRDTDFCGWMDENRNLGVLFTGIEEASVAAARQAIGQKVRECLCKGLSVATSRFIEVVVMTFPAEDGPRGKDERFIPAFYPELFQRSPSGRFVDGIKRLMDIVGSLFALLLFSPLFLSIPILVKATSPGPVFFRQTRLGRYGKPFTFLKFRTMHVNNNDEIHREFIRKYIAGGADRKEDGSTVYKITSDPRITPVGGFLRKSSLDELPQFFNVLRGEMSLVGPRPPIPYEVEQYRPWHDYRVFARRPGITGLWQVKGRSLTSFDEMVRLDLHYIRTWSLWLDFKLLLATPMAVLRGKGAY